MSRILIAEDELRISSFIEKGLAAAGLATVTVRCGTDALDFALTGDFDLLLLDIGLPGIDGYEVLRRLRAEECTLPVIVLTARDSGEDVLASLGGGANDYMAKPFRFDELLARVRLRMTDAVRATGAVPVVEAALEVTGLRLDLRTRRAAVGDRQVDLSAREFALAEEFLRNHDQVLSREQLLSRVWGYDFDPGSNIVDVYVGYLRAKFGAGRIETVRGMGYRLR
ncbi:response regulator transcription factor [Cryobacterium sp. TMT1-21]|uniref:response regulator transcription factor n=1 Tax=unclassified Cryobacterium TaxID=2649013 RepID=UPI00106BB1D1|nr:MULTISPECIES: response regulator transcription factor [unclassified Cryobacterium]TFC84708.1 response regulator transcription factor [Cryobacterium sp. TmT2-59]TFD15718.1 response regulator transcription factor [Cryobacterium sp. TMT1-21]TFD19413.1 response regulator transcription factor [Cryobacterium sp. TMT4-10]TFD26750.1 response regulator transcription factor [Cryobacterium sp. TMT2-23]TFD39365.1 response regulator transcription factor [Cryobacterium sp. TMT2-10]